MYEDYALKIQSTMKISQRIIDWLSCSPDIISWGVIQAPDNSVITFLIAVLDIKGQNNYEGTSHF
ncbi:hypothetical protein Smp_143790 [Schistosoma mansoni]|uniref:Uncharacterized protein n=1 Tax=Schistosoma mansoni TaxID=6183 RepID=G4VSR2_SCHMA|nr:hypothetical protein Smp_143790 [Schistosoma mansoni]|eukprot:XP_018655492.1 hypothetical protein Smp_143790 [Schistosoma mansoni]